MNLITETFPVESAEIDVLSTKYSRAREDERARQSTAVCTTYNFNKVGPGVTVGVGNKAICTVPGSRIDIGICNSNL